MPSQSFNNFNPYTSSNQAFSSYYDNQVNSIGNNTNSNSIEKNQKASPLTLNSQNNSSNMSNNNQQIKNQNSSLSTNVNPNTSFVPQKQLNTNNPPTVSAQNIALNQPQQKSSPLTTNYINNTKEEKQSISGPIEFKKVEAAKLMKSDEFYNELYETRKLKEGEAPPVQPFDEK